MPIAVSENQDMRGLLAHACWVCMLIVWFATASAPDHFGMLCALLVWAATLQPVREAVANATHKQDKVLPTKADVQASLHKEQYLTKMGLCSSSVDEQCEAAQLLGTKGSKVEILADGALVCLTVQDPSRVSGVVNVVASEPWNGFVLNLKIKNSHIAKATLELYRTQGAEIESWQFVLDKGGCFLVCSQNSRKLKVLRVRLVSEDGKTRAHLFTGTALDTGKLNRELWEVDFGGKKRSAELLEAQTTGFTTRPDGKTVQHRATWIALSLDEAQFSLILHSPVQNRLLVLVCYHKPTADVACALLTALHSDFPLSKVRVKDLMIASCVQGRLNPALVGDDVFGPGVPGDSAYLRFKKVMPLFDPEKPTVCSLGEDQHESRETQVTLRIGRA